jgi:hypothetical protein
MLLLIRHDLLVGELQYQFHSKSRPAPEGAVVQKCFRVKVPANKPQCPAKSNIELAAF